MFSLYARADSGSGCPPAPKYWADRPNDHISRVLTILCVISGIVSGVIAMVLFLMHAFNMRNPSEQIKIMRIILLLPVFSIFCISSAADVTSALDLEPWKDMYEGVAMSYFLMLVFAYTGPDRRAQEEYFSRLSVKDRNKEVVANGGWKLFKKSSLMVHQYTIVGTVVAVATCISNATGTYCLTSNSPRFSHIWLTIIQTVSVGAAVTAAVRVTMQLKSEIRDRPILKQLLAFKLLIFVNWLQSLVFKLAAPHVSPTSSLNYVDIVTRLPNMLLCMEMIPFAIFFHFAYSIKPYKHSMSVAYHGLAPKDTREHEPEYSMSAIGAILRALNPIALPMALREVYRSQTSVGGHDAGQTHYAGYPGEYRHDNQVELNPTAGVSPVPPPYAGNTGYFPQNDQAEYYHGPATYANPPNRY